MLNLAAEIRSYDCKKIIFLETKVTEMSVLKHFQ